MRTCEGHLSYSACLPTSRSPNPEPSWAHLLKCTGDYCSLEQMVLFNYVVTEGIGLNNVDFSGIGASVGHWDLREKAAIG